MSIKKINGKQLPFLLILAVAMVSCSNKLIVAETNPATTTNNKKIIINSIVYCSSAKFNNYRDGKWFSGSAKTNTNVGELVINFDFCNTGYRPVAPNEIPFFNSLPFSFGNNVRPVSDFLQAVILLDRQNSLYVEYPECGDDSGFFLFGANGKITGGTGVFSNATGTINSKIKIDRESNVAITSHQGVIYLD